jgi:DNA-binding SARP family transcriptional activator
MTLRLVLFGTPAVEHDQASWALPFERRHQLVAYLALERTCVPRAELAALLWPELPAKLAYTDLRKTLFRLASRARCASTSTPTSSRSRPRCASAGSPTRCSSGTASSRPLR